MSLQVAREQLERPFRPLGRVWLLIAALVGIGAAGFAIGFHGPSRLDAWLWLAIWFLVFGGFAQGVLVWAATFRIAQARWTPVINRFGHSALFFLPVSFLVLIALLVGAREFVPWITHPRPEKAAWLNQPFMIARNLATLAVLDILNLLLVRWSLVADARVRRGQTVTEKHQYRLTAIAVAVVMMYTIAFTVISYDFVMSLSPDWFSTMFAPYYWVTNAYAGLAVLVIMSALLRRPLAVMRYVEGSQFSDLGNLMLGFSLFSMGLFFAQFLTIWYENLPKETFFLIIRYYKGSWQWLSWVSFALAYAAPFLFLQSRALKHSPKLLSAVSVLIILGVALERYVLVVPSVEPAKLGLSPVPGVGGLAFLGVFMLAVILFLMRYPAISSADEALREIEPQLEALR